MHLRRPQFLLQTLVLLIAVVALALFAVITWRRSQRRTNAMMEELASQIVRVLDNSASQMTVRQVFYQLTSLGAIEKTEEQYRVVIRFLTEMRKEGRIGFDAIAHNTRWVHKPPSYPNLEAAVRTAAESYRRRPWDDQPVYVEVWLEKDALAGVFYQITARFDVPLYVTRGYSSITFLKAAADTIGQQGKPAYLFCFGDSDPSGYDITRAAEADILRYAPDTEITVERVAVTEEQIERWHLPARPTKKSDSRSKTWDRESVELDAIPLESLQELVEECIRRHIDVEAWEATLRQEPGHRNRLTSWTSRSKRTKNSAKAG